MKHFKTLLLLFLLAGAMLVSAAFVFLFLAEKEIYGQVVDADSGAPIPAAVVQVDTLRLQTDRRGEFVSYSRRQRGIAVRVSAPGYLPTAYTFDIPWYLKRGRLRVPLAPLGVAIQVLDAWDNTPLAGVRLSAGGTARTTGSGGLATFSLRAGDLPLTIVAERAGYHPLRVELTRLPQDSSELPLPLRLEPVVLEGRVIAADDGLPLGGVAVSAGETAQHTDDRGRFTLARLAPGDRIAITPNELFLPTQISFDGQPSLTVRLRPRPLTATVLSALDGSPVAGATLQLRGRIATSDEDGQAHFRRIPPRGELRIAHPAYVPQTVPYDAGTPPLLRLLPRVLRGAVLDAAGGQPLSRTQVLANGLPLPLDAGGQFQLANLTLPLTLTLRHPGYRIARLTLLPTGDGLRLEGAHLQPQPCPPAQPPTAVPCLQLALSPFSARAIYIPFSLLAHPDAVLGLLDLAARTELNAVVLDVKGDRGLLAWDSHVLQADALGIDGNREGWLALDTFLAEARARGLYTIARLVVFKDNPLAFGKPELAVTQADGSIWTDGEGLAWANPFREEVWDYNIALAKEVAAMGFDEINLDYIRFPSDGDVTAIVYAEENTAQTRTEAIRAFMRRMREALAPYPVALSADVFGLTVWVTPESDMNIGQRVVDIAPFVDYLSPMVYPSTFAAGNLGFDDPAAHPYEVIFRSVQAAAGRVPPPVVVRPWLQAYWYSTGEMLRQKQAARDANAGGWVWWNAAGVYDETIFDSP